MAKKHTPEEIFSRAMEIDDTEQRAAYLDKACAGDEKLRAQVDGLLKWDQAAGSFMDVPDRDPQITLDAAPMRDITGMDIGRYKLLEKIGEGGMAVVYMAEQRHPIARRVAVKLIKLGMDTKQVIARFEAERQALAMMDHPNIARVFDAGSTDTGRPYFVMELVKGLPITEFCDDGQLFIHDRRTGTQSRPYPICRDLEQLERNVDLLSWRDWVDFCPDGIHVAVVGDNNDVNLISIETGETVQSFPYPDTVLWMDCSPKGNLLVTASWDDKSKDKSKGKTRLWDPETGREILQLGTLEPCNRYVHFGRGDRELILGNTTNVLHVLDASPLTKSQTEKPPIWHIGNEGENIVIVDLEYDESGELLLSTGRGDGVRLWNVETGQQISPVGEFDSSYRVTYSPDGQWIAATGVRDSSNAFEVWKADPPYNKCFSEEIVGESYAFSPDGKHVASAGYDGKIRIWTPKLKSPKESEPCKNVTFSQKSWPKINSNDACISRGNYIGDT